MSVVGRLLVVVCALVGVVGGAMLTVQTIVYFAASEYVPSLSLGENLTLVGVVGFGIFCGGLLRIHPVGRVASGVGLALAGFVATVIVAFVVSLAGDPGGERGNLESGTIGFVWLVVGLVEIWRVVTRRWPSLRTSPAAEQSARA